MRRSRFLAISGFVFFVASGCAKSPNAPNPTFTAPGGAGPAPTSTKKTPKKTYLDEDIPTEFEEIDGLEDVIEAAESEEALRFSVGLPPDTVFDTSVDLTGEHAVDNQNHTAKFHVSNKSGLKDYYSHFSPREKELLFEFYRLDVEALFETSFSKAYLEDPGQIEKVADLGRKLRVLFFQAQMGHLVSDGNGFNDKGGTFKTWGANFILPRILSKDFRKRFHQLITPGIFDPSELRGNLTLEDLEQGILEYFESSPMKRYFEDVAAQKKFRAKPSEPALTFKVHTLFKSTVSLVFQMESLVTNPKKDAALQILKRAKSQSAPSLKGAWAEAVAGYHSLLATEGTGLVIFPVDHRGDPLVLIKVRIHTLAPPKTQPLRKPLPGLTHKAASSPQILSGSSVQRRYAYVLEYVHREKLDEYVRNAQAMRVEDRTQYFWKDGDISAKLLVAIHLPDVQDPQDEDAHILMGRQYSMTGRDRDAIRNIKKSPHLGQPQSILLDLRPFEAQFK